MRAAAYIRVSTAKQANDGLSLGEQRRRIEAYAESQGWQLAEVFEERGVSGPIPLADRPEGSKLADQASDFDRLLVVKLDRLGGGANDLLSVIEGFTDQGCHVVSLSEAIDTSTATGRLLRTVLAGVAEFEHDRISERVSESEAAKARKGRPHGGPRPLGLVSEDGAFVEVPTEVETVRRVFAEFAAGSSLSAIARGLHEDGVRTVGGGLWRQSTVAGMLRNVVYNGQIRHKDEVFEGQHAAIIDPEMWLQVQALLDARPSRGRGRPPKGLHLFRAGLLRCAKCGEAMVPRTNGGYQLYYCNGRQKLGKEFCDTRSIRRAAVDGAVFRYFEQVGLDIEATREQVADARSRRLAEVRALAGQAADDLHQAEERIARVRRDYVDGELPAAEWRELKTELEGERTAAAAEASRLAASLEEVEAWADMQDAEAEVLRSLAEIRAAIAGEITEAEGIDAIRAVLVRTFERFELGPAGGPVHAELAWRGVRRDLIITPVPREQAIEGYSGNARPILRRLPAPLHGDINDSASRVVDCLFASIPVGESV